MRISEEASKMEKRTKAPSEFLSLGQNWNQLDPSFFESKKQK